MDIETYDFVPQHKLLLYLILPLLYLVCYLFLFIVKVKERIEPRTNGD